MDLLQVRSQAAGHASQTSTQGLSVGLQSYPKQHHNLRDTQRAAQILSTQQYPHYGYPGYHSPQSAGLTTPFHHMGMAYGYGTTPVQPGISRASGYSPAASSYMYPQWSYPSQQYLYPGTSVPSSPQMMYYTPVHSTPKWHSQVTRCEGSRLLQDLSNNKQSFINTPSTTRDSGIHSLPSLLLEGSSSSSLTTASKDLRNTKEVESSSSPDCASRDKNSTIATALSLSGISKEDLLPLSPFSFTEEDIFPPLSPTALFKRTPHKPVRNTETETQKPVPSTVPQKPASTVITGPVQKKPKSGCKPKFLSKEAVEIMNSWYDQHLAHPYPSQEEKEHMVQQGGITMAQLNSWFNNRRNRSFNTGPKRQKRKLEEQLVSLCHNLTASNSQGAVPAAIVQEISSLIQQNLQPSKRTRLH